MNSRAGGDLNHRRDDIGDAGEYRCRIGNATEGETTDFVTADTGGEFDDALEVVETALEAPAFSGTGGFERSGTGQGRGEERAVDEGHFDAVVFALLGEVALLRGGEIPVAQARAGDVAQFNGMKPVLPAEGEGIGRG